MTNILILLFSSPLLVRKKIELAYKISEHKKLFYIVKFRKDPDAQYVMQYEILGRDIRITTNKIYALIVWKFLKIFLICVALPLLILYKLL
jgi:hypothetical protein